VLAVGPSPYPREQVGGAPAAAAQVEAAQVEAAQAEAAQAEVHLAALAVPRIMGNVVVKGGLAQNVARADPARVPGSITASVCKAYDGFESDDS